MARSKIKGTKGKPVKKTKNRDKLRASIHIDADRGRVNWKNDNNPTMYLTSGGKKVEDTHLRDSYKNPGAAWGDGRPGRSGTERIGNDHKFSRHARKAVKAVKEGTKDGWRYRAKAKPGERW